MIDKYSSAAKRSFDLVASAIGLLLLFPLMALIGAAIKLTSRGPALFRQRRVGQHGKHFFVLKYRTMVAGAEALGRETTGSNDPRITQLGRFLRKTKLDELPQLVNVFRGEMSLVGPRPEIPYYADKYSPEDRVVLSVRPGITDPCSLEMADLDSIMERRGSRDAAEFYVSDIQPRKLQLQKQYICNRSFFGDVLIILRTISRILSIND